MKLSATFVSVKMSLAAAFLTASVGMCEAEQKPLPSTPYPKHPVGYLDTSHAVKPFPAFKRYCKMHDCTFSTAEPRILHLTRKRWDAMNDVNHAVNGGIIPTPDKKQYGLNDYWTVPVTGKGDCEDYVLGKREQLLDRGFPKSSLLLELVQTANGEGHAVLVVRTDMGDFILDNLTSLIRGPGQVYDSGYKQNALMDPTDFTQFVKIEGIARSSPGKAYGMPEVAAIK